jgi:hypothetical protein
LAGLSRGQAATAADEAHFTLALETFPVVPGACVRIGELSRELDRSAGDTNPAATLPDGRKSKTETLADAGISTSTAHNAPPVANRPSDRSAERGQSSAEGATVLPVPPAIFSGCIMKANS